MRPETPDLLPFLHVKEGAMPAAVVKHRQGRTEALRVKLAILQVSVEANRVLSSDRAKVVYNYLVQKGIHSSRLSHKGYGSAKPIANNNTEEGKAKNRRTVFVIKSN